jgi:proteasome lid subunit RPN8/RPN11/molybdopterin converting factor small subunit
MAIAVYIPTPLRGLTGGAGHVHAAGTTIAELIGDLDRQYPGLGARLCEGKLVRQHVNVFVNGQEMRCLAGEATALADGDEVAFIPALVGGQEPRQANEGSVIEITQAHRDEMIEHAQEDFPNECCGLLFGRDKRAERLLRMENIEHSPLNYRVDGKALFEAFDAMDRVGLDLVGIYHSHTHSAAEPSRTDIALAGYPDAHYLIVSLADRARPVLRAFTIVDGSVEEQEVVVR